MLEMWILVALSALASWLITQWYYERKIVEYKQLAQTKESDVYHLNEAHYLLKQSKEKTIADLKEELDSHKSQLKMLSHDLSIAEESNKSLLSQVVQFKQKKADLKKGKNSFGSISAKVNSSQPDQSASKDLPAVHPLVGVVEEDASIPLVESNGQAAEESQTKKIKKLKSKSKGYKKKISSLQQEIAGLKDQLDEVRAVEIIKEVPIKITKTVEIRETLDRRKLKKFIKKLPVITSRKVAKKDVVKGTPRVVRVEE